MPTPPFKPPETDPPKHPRPPVAPGSPLKAVLVGLAVDFGGTTVCGIVISVIYAIQLHGQGVADSDMREAMDNMPHDSALYVGGILLGALMSVFGGYVCARIARTDEYRPGLVMAAVSAVIGLTLGSSGPVDSMALLLAVTGIACNLLGVKYGAEYNRRAQAPAAPDEGPSTP
jgi:hypothetical protein